MRNYNAIELSTLMDAWSEKALTQGWTKEWVDGAIYPCEMVYFLARCQQLHINMIIESGRQNGYSTKILAEYGRLNKTDIYSIDYESDPAMAQRCRAYLSGYPELHILKGEASILLGRLLAQRSDKRIAILMDGPKSFWAISLVFASVHNKALKIAGQHNLVRGKEDCALFKKCTKESIFYEDFCITSKGPWDRLRAEESALCVSKESKRSLEKSSLGVMSIPDSGRIRFMTTIHPKFKLFQPFLIILGWKLRLFLLTSKLFSLSFRFKS